MYGDITGKVIDNYNEELRRQQEEDYYQQIQEQQRRQEQKYQEQQKELQQQEETQQSISSFCKPGYVNEYRCFGNNIQQKYQYSDCNSTWIHYWHCAYGCENGKCKDCYDSDGGKDYYTKGYIDYGSEGKGYDRCYEGYENYLVEYYCDSSGSHIEIYKCPYGCSDGACNSEPQTTTLTVSHVLDGDSIQLSDGEEVRLIGINAPEFNEKCYEESKEKLQNMVLGKQVTLESDVNDKDQYGRLLRYVYVDGIFVNLEMVRSGLAHKYEYGSNTKYSALFEQAENEAKEKCRCIWQPCLKKTKKCENKYLEEYRCSGDWSERKLQYSDCSFVWVLWEACEHGCGDDGKCKSTSPCTIGFKCKDSYHRGYQKSNCSWDFIEYCKYGCVNGECNPKPSIPNYIQDQCIHIINFHFNAAGNDNYNLNDEYVTFRNKCSYSIDMSGWTIKDETASHIYTIPSFVLEGGATFTLYTGTGTNTDSALYWGRTSGNYAAIWNNDGDTLFLRDSDGNLVLSQSYSGY